MPSHVNKLRIISLSWRFPYADGRASTRILERAAIFRSVGIPPFDTKNCFSFGSVKVVRPQTGCSLAFVRCNQAFEEHVIVWFFFLAERNIASTNWVCHTRRIVFVICPIFSLSTYRCWGISWGNVLPILAGCVPDRLASGRFRQIDSFTSKGFLINLATHLMDEKCFDYCYFFSQ